MTAEPELFATYQKIIAESPDVIRAHVGMLVGQVRTIIADGIRRGEFADVDADATGRAIFHATVRFHAPAHAADWNEPGIDAAFEDLWALAAARADGAARNGKKPAPARQRRVARGWSNA